MNQQRFGQKFGLATGAQAGTTPEEGSAKGAQKPASAKPGTTNQAVLGPFTLRDLAVFAATVILLVASLLPTFFGRFNLWNAGSLFFLGLGIVLPLIVSALFVGRRLAPATRVRIGSLSVDQFASVVAAFALAFFFVSAAAAYVPSLLVGLVGSVVLFAGTVLSRYIPYFAGDFLGRDESPAHVMARESAVPLPRPHTPKEPKPEGSPVPAASAASATPAASAGAFSSPAASAAVSSAPEVQKWTAAGHPGPATQAADVVPSPTATNASVTPAVEETTAGDTPTAAAAPVESAPTAAAAASAAAAPETAFHDAGAGDPAPARQAAAEPAATAVHQQVRSVEPIGATVDPASRPEESYEEPAQEAFWFAVAQHRTAVDAQTGAPAFVIEPGGWVLALEDRGHEFLVQHTDGRVGVLRDLSNIERG
ncbi:cytoskeletal protein RodZ [Arthrobacter sp. UYEF6]